MIPNHYIKPNWPAPTNIRACCTIRRPGVSQGIYAANNLATHVADNPKYVARNRQLLQQQLLLPTEPYWLQQTHSTTVNEIDPKIPCPNADASFSFDANQIAVVLTADCLPLLLTDTDGSFVAAIHAGWRGLANGIIEATLQRLNANPKQLLVWLGPAISSAHFEVGPDVYQAFCQQDPAASQAFRATADNKWLADIYQLARLRLNAQGVMQISGGEYCTYADPTRFYSYRRDGQTGRLASLIWRVE